MFVVDYPNLRARTDAQVGSAGHRLVVRARPLQLRDGHGRPRFSTLLMVRRG